MLMKVRKEGDTMPVKRINKVWWVDFYYRGKRVRKRSPINNRRDAERYEFLLRDLQETECAGKLPTCAIHDLWEECQI